MDKSWPSEYRKLVEQQTDMARSIPDLNMLYLNCQSIEQS